VSSSSNFAALYEYFDIREVNLSEEAGGMVEASSSGTRSNFRFGIGSTNAKNGDENRRSTSPEILKNPLKVKESFVVIFLGHSNRFSKLEANHPPFKC